MSFIDHYSTLGLEPSATEEEIRRAYRRLVRDCHPDLNPGDQLAAERTRHINDAYAVLRDPARRAAFDARRLASLSTAGQKPGFRSTEHYRRDRQSSPGSSADPGIRMHTADPPTKGWSRTGSAWTVALGTEVTEAAALHLSRLARRDRILAGVLRTGDHANLTPGRWMVFSGAYETRDLARRAARRAQSKFEGARAVYVMAEASL